MQEYKNARVRKYPSVFLPCTSQKKHTSVFLSWNFYTSVFYPKGKNTLVERIHSMSWRILSYLRWNTWLFKLNIRYNLNDSEEIIFCIFILRSFQALSRVFWKFLIWPPTPLCIPMDILAWMDCVRSSAGKISYIDIFSNSNLQKYWYFLTFYSVYLIK